MLPDSEKESADLSRVSEVSLDQVTLPQLIPQQKDRREKVERSGDRLYDRNFRPGELMQFVGSMTAAVSTYTLPSHSGGQNVSSTWRWTYMTYSCRTIELFIVRTVVFRYAH